MMSHPCPVSNNIETFRKRSLRSMYHFDALVFEGFNILMQFVIASDDALFQPVYKKLFLTYVVLVTIYCIKFSHYIMSFKLHG